MKRKAVSGIVLMLLLTSMLSSAFIMEPVKAEGGTIYIRADGSVDPSTAPILNVGNVYYTFTADIYDSIVVQRDNIVLDGNGYSLARPIGVGLDRGIDLSGRSNVTVKNIRYVRGFTHSGIFLNCSSGIVLANNTVTGNGGYWFGTGIYLEKSSQNTITNNTVAWNGFSMMWVGWIRRYGIYLKDSNSNTVSDNIIAGNAGVYLWNSSENTIAGNSITDDAGVQLWSSSSNRIAGNSIANQHYGGVSIDYGSSQNIIIGNNITKNEWYGIYIKDSPNNAFYDNLLNGNKYGLIVESWGLGIEGYLQSIDTSNLIDGKPIYYLVNQQNLVINPSTCPQIGYLALISSTNITVENIDYGNQYYGLLIVNTSNSQIINNNLTNNYYYGFVLLYSSGNIVSGNNLANNGWGGALRESRDNIISGNTITNGFYGVTLYYSSRNTIIENNIKANGYHGIWLYGAFNNILSSNTIANSGEYGIYFTNSSNNQITNNNIIENEVGIYVSRDWYIPPGRNNIITNNNVTGNHKGGISSVELSESTISDNIVANNGGHGILFWGGYKNTISRNIVTNNSGDGIFYGSGSHNTLSDNLVTNNDGYGVNLASSSYNTLSGNVMAGNRYNFRVEGYRRWGYEAGLINYVDTSNTVDGKPVYYWIKERDKVVPSDAGYVMIVDSTNITIKDVTLTRNHAGVFLAFTSRSSIQNIISANNYFGVILLGSHHNNITGSTITNSENNGFYLYQGSSYNTIIENNIESNSGGVSFWDRSGNNIISRNIIANNNGYGMLFSESSNGYLSSNAIQNNNGYGVYLANSYNFTLRDNLLSDNKFGLSVYGTTLHDYLHSIDTSNLINDKPVHYWVNRRNMQVPLNAGYVALINSTRITVRDQTLTSNGQGVLIAYTNNSIIVNNNIANNGLGIYLYHSYNNILTRNTITNNEGHGVYLHASSKNTITGNNITNNGYYGVYLYWSSNNLLSSNTIANSKYYGVYIYGSSDNTIYHNNFINNFIGPWYYAQAGAYAGTNTWDDGYPSGGNYWSDYRGVDKYSGPYQNEPGSDGIGDWPYYIPGYYGYADKDRYPLMNPWVEPTPSVEKSFIESTLVETLLGQRAVLNNVAASGDLNGTLNFTSFEIISITTGSFAGKGFSKGEWQATLEGTSYKGYWAGALFFKLPERKIYLKGAMTGDLSGTLEGYLTETILESGIYDQYRATWQIGTATTSATVNLKGTLTYESDSEFPATELYVLQTSIEGTVSGHYNNSISVVLTHIRVLNDIPYNGEGFSIISYTSDLGTGEGWTYDRLESAGILRLKGLFTGPLFGIISATLDETTLPRTLVIKIERVDLGLPPMADLKVKTWGPGRASPGQTITYVIELRNDGLKSAENITVVYLLPFATDFVSASVPGSYDDIIHVVRWDFENIPPKTSRYLSLQVRILWGLPEGIPLTSEISFLPKEEADLILQHASLSLTEKIKIALQALWIGITKAVGVPTIPTEYPEAIRGAHTLGVHLGVTKAFIENEEYGFEVKALSDAVFKQHYSLQENGWRTTDGEYYWSPSPDLSFDKIVTDLKQLYGYSPRFDPDKSSTLTITTARDPNIKYGPEGYVSPGQTLNYKVEYENEGEGIAFGVYFTDTLDEDLDDSTLEIGPVISTRDGSVIAGPGTYNPSTRTITWLVGEVGPGEGGFANFSVNVRDDAPEGTEIINFATVYFPSVPETTRTNAIVSTVRLYIDTTPPTTLLTVGEPQYIDPMNNTYVSSTTRLTLTPEDEPEGSGIASTAYRLYNATYDSGWVTYTEPFYLIALIDGVYSIDYNSTDNAGNIETINTATVILDNTPPTTTLTIGEPKFVTDTTYVTQETPFKLEAEDNTGSGVYSTAYRIYNSTYDSGWLPYTAPFYLTALADGVYTIEFNSIDNVDNVELSNTATVILDTIGPSLAVENPPVGWALQDGVTFTISAMDAGSGVSFVSLSIREANGGEGKPVGFEDIPATYNATTGKWTLFFDTLQLLDGYYVVVLKVKDNLGNVGSIIVPYSIRNWAVIELLPASETNKAGRTMPVKFSLRVAASVDPNQPFVYNEDLTIKIYATNDPSNILQTSTFGDTARDYRIDPTKELYITNFQTLKTPMQYTVSVYRGIFLIDSFNFSTVK